MLEVRKMGTRAVVHVNLEPLGYGKDIWIATHWDGYPSVLGRDLKLAISKELNRAKKEKSTDKGGFLQAGVYKGVADRSIDAVSTDGKKEFDKLYDDFAEYEYEILPDGKVRVRHQKDTWKEDKHDEWVPLEKALEIPHYFKGGIVQSTGQAVVHKGELVIPAKQTTQLRKLMKSNAGQGGWFRESRRHRDAAIRSRKRKIQRKVAGMGHAKYGVYKNGKLLKKVKTTLDAGIFLHRYQGQSVDYATKYGGYKVKKIR
jgi:hypothetical protein